MTGVLRYLHLLALAVWVGTLTFFSFAAAPAIFSTLPAAEAGHAVAALFPAYYATGWLAGGAALAAALGLGWLRGKLAPSLAWRAGLLAGMLAVSLYAGLVVLPQVRAARAAGDEEAWRRGHRLSVLLNLAVVAGGLAAVAFAARAEREG